jgi:hypothetical protein
MPRKKVLPRLISSEEMGGSTSAKRLRHPPFPGRIDLPRETRIAAGFRSRHALFRSGDRRVFVIREQVGGVAINCDAASFAQVLFLPAA